MEGYIILGEDDGHNDASPSIVQDDAFEAVGEDNQVWVCGWGGGYLFHRMCGWGAVWTRCVCVCVCVCVRVCTRVCVCVCLRL